VTDAGPVEPGPLLAEGRSATVFLLEDGWVLRRSKDSRHDVGTEAAVLRWAARHGVPVPRVREAAGTDLVLERVHGPSMLTALLDDAAAAERHTGGPLPTCTAAWTGFPVPSVNRQACGERRAVTAAEAPAQRPRPRRGRGRGCIRDPGTRLAAGERQRGAAAPAAQCGTEARGRHGIRSTWR
jgi:hypothetical protein